MVRSAIAALAFVVLFPFVAQAQGLPTASKHSNVKWYSVTNVTFKAGQQSDALQLVYEHFVPAANDAGLEPARILVHETGPWDVTYIFAMSEGPAGLEWEVTPNGEKFWASLAKLEGGAEKAQEIFGQYISMVSRGSTTIMRERGM